MTRSDAPSLSLPLPSSSQSLHHKQMLALSWARDLLVADAAAIFIGCEAHRVRLVPASCKHFRYTKVDKKHSVSLPTPPLSGHKPSNTRGHNPDVTTLMSPTVGYTTVCREQRTLEAARKSPQPDFR